jgi:NhaP-type Na+/H+ or K+/H+ antiporter
VALALSLRGLGDDRASHHRELIVSMTYVIVVFSILVQGLTVGRMTSALLPDCPKPSDPSPQMASL